MPHVFKKIIEGIPSLTKSDVATSMIFPFFFVWVCASVFHARPSSMNFCFRQSVTGATRKLLVDLASTRRSFSRFQAMGMRLGNVATFTFAPPSSYSSYFPRVPNDLEAAKFLPFKILETPVGSFRVENNVGSVISGVSHIDAPSSFVVRARSGASNTVWARPYTSKREKIANDNRHSVEVAA